MTERQPRMFGRRGFLLTGLLGLLSLLGARLLRPPGRRGFSATPRTARFWRRDGA